MKGHKSTISLLSVLQGSSPLPCCLSVLGCMSPSLVSTSRSAPSWQLAMLSLCVSLGADNCCSDLRWTALESGGSCLLLYWGMFALLQRWRTANPWHPPFLSPPPPPPPPTISFRHSDCLLRLVFFFSFFFSEWQLMAEIIYTCLHCLFVPTLPSKYIYLSNSNSSVQFL